jgi:ketosteroid isomerase-like protein
MERAVEAWNRDDVDGVLRELAPDFVFRSAMGRMLAGGGGEYHGRDGWARWHEEAREAFERFHIELDQVLAIGEMAIAILQMELVSRGGGVPLEQVVGWTWRGRREGITELNTHFDLAEGLRQFASWL